ncbi:MAG: ABC transporter ATP-binding protein [Planctomycetes bacterium]|nr:ABC transporter ATP-binding protein [Planctomycetota bacterium]
MIEVEGVEKAYGAVRALQGVSFTVARGEVFGLLGHNGAGKSTLAKVLCGLVRPDVGAARIAGKDVAKEPLEARARFGYLPEETILYDELTAREHVELFGAVRGLAPAVARERGARLLEFLDLAHAADRGAATYSRGMRRKTAIAMTVVGDPEALLFDEPTDGLDPDGALRFAELLAELKRRERTVIVNTHILGLVEKRCDRIGVLDKGRLVACGTLPELRAQAGAPGADLEDVFLKLTGRAAKGAEGLLD